MTTDRGRALPHRGHRVFVAGVAMAAFALFSWSTPSASGHNAVLETSPEAGSTISTSPVDIRVVTNDTLLDLTGTGSGFAIVVRDAIGLYYGDGCVNIGDTDLSQTAHLGNAGDYTVTFQYVSADGHSLSDSFGFIFAPSPTHVPASGFDEAPKCGVEAIMPTTEGDETPATDPATTPEGVVVDATSEDMLVDQQPERWPITTAIAGVLVVLSITLMVWMVRRRNGN
jgi:copper resistance protein C